MIITLLLIFAAIIVIGIFGVAGFLLLIKLGVIVHAASQPPHQDTGTYTLSQGREVRPEDEH